MANTLKSFRDGAAGFIDRLDVRVHAIPVLLAICFAICRMEMLYTFLKVSFCTVYFTMAIATMSLQK